MRVVAVILCITVLMRVCTAGDPEKYTVWGAAGVVYSHHELMQHGVWVTGDVIYNKTDGLMFRADKAVEANPTGNLVYLAIPDDLATSFGPMCYRAAEKHYPLRLCGAFLPHSSPNDAKHPSVNFVIWKIHSPKDPDELPPDQKVIMGPDTAIPGYTIIPKKP